MTSQHSAGPPPATHPMDPRRGRDLVQGDSNLDFDEYRRLMDACRARAAERRNAPKPAPA